MDPMGSNDVPTSFVNPPLGFTEPTLVQLETVDVEGG